MRGPLPTFSLCSPVQTQCVPLCRKRRSGSWPIKRRRPYILLFRCDLHPISLHVPGLSSHLLSPTGRQTRHLTGSCTSRFALLSFYTYIVFFPQYYRIHILVRYEMLDLSRPSCGGLLYCPMLLHNTPVHENCVLQPADQPMQLRQHGDARQCKRLRAPLGGQIIKGLDPLFGRSLCLDCIWKMHVSVILLYSFFFPSLPLYSHLFRASACCTYILLRLFSVSSFVFSLVAPTEYGLLADGNMQTKHDEIPTSMSPSTTTTLARAGPQSKHVGNIAAQIKCPDGQWHRKNDKPLGSIAAGTPCFNNHYSRVET